MTTTLPAGSLGSRLASYEDHMTTRLAQLTEVPTGCEVVEFGRRSYVCDPSAPLAANVRVAVWGDVGSHRIAVVGIHKPSAFDPGSTVRLGNWCGPRKGWEFNVYPCPPNSAARVVGEIAKVRRPRRGAAELQRFLARRLRSAVV
jgi:hypothetical protein